jgi:predicted dehydrogenase
MTTKDEKQFNLAMLGMVEGNGHPYSWSAIINGGYDKEEMSKCPYAGIPVYLNQQPPENLGIPGAKVTHIWTDDPGDAVKVAKASKIENVVSKATDVIGEVDAVIISTDKGYEHVERARPFIEAGVPVFIDKPLTDNEEDLVTFCRWENEGAKIMSSSCMRYAKEVVPYHKNYAELGEIRYASVTMAKKWETYGIHALEMIYPVLGTGFISVRNTGTYERNIVHIKHECGTDIVIPTIKDMYGAFSVMQLCGTADNITIKFKDTFTAFKAQLEAFAAYLHTGGLPFPFAETVELMRIVIAGIKSREQDGIEIYLDDIAPGV